MGKRTWRMNRSITRRIFRNPHGFDANAYRSGVGLHAPLISAEAEKKASEEYQKLRATMVLYGECVRCGELTDLSPEAYARFGERLCTGCAV
jgi:hypothetical protein